MGLHGKRPMPTKLRMLHGEHRPSHLNMDEPQPRDALPECPDGAADDVREIWDETVRELDIMYIAHAADRDALYAYCEAVATHRRSSTMLAQSGLLIRGQRNNYVRNPLLQVQRDAAQTIKVFAQEFGLTPSSRSRIAAKNAIADEEDTDNPFAGSG